MMLDFLSAAVNTLKVKDQIPGQENEQHFQWHSSNKWQQFLLWRTGVVQAALHCHAAYWIQLWFVCILVRCEHHSSARQHNWKRSGVSYHRVFPSPSRHPKYWHGQFSSSKLFNWYLCPFIPISYHHVSECLHLGLRYFHCNILHCECPLQRLTPQSLPFNNWKVYRNSLLSALHSNSLRTKNGSSGDRRVGFKLFSQYPRFSFEIRLLRYKNNCLHDHDLHCGLQCCDIADLNKAQETDSSATNGSTKRPTPELSWRLYSHAHFCYFVSYRYPPNSISDYASEKDCFGECFERSCFILPLVFDFVLL